MPIKTALLSVYDKTGLAEFALGLKELGIEIVSTGKTASFLAERGISTTSVSDLTGFPEVMNGRLKTLHPRIMGGILGLRDAHAADAEAHGLPWIDLVACNLYPFEQAVRSDPLNCAHALENIDVGGPTMLRAAAKNHAWVIPVVDIEDYFWVLQKLKLGDPIELADRRSLAAKAFAHTSHYDSLIHGYLSSEAFPEVCTVGLKLVDRLRYGENPGQKATLYEVASTSPLAHKPSLVQAAQLQGKPLSYTNLLDAEAGKTCALEFEKPACVIIKHATVCAASVREKIAEAFASAFLADQRSAFGGAIALNRCVDEELARQIREHFFELVLAPGFSDEAVEIFSQKPNVRLLSLTVEEKAKVRLTGQFISGGLLLQEADDSPLSSAELSMPTEKKPSEEELREALFAWQVVKHMKSNAIAITENNSTAGLGQGQVSRIDAVEIAIKKASGGGLALASDGFFPFRDSIDAIASAGIGVIIQPGGSLRDEEVIRACDEHGIAMIFTGRRCFRH